MKSIIDFCIPDQPKKLLQLIKKENYQKVQTIVERETADMLDKNNSHDDNSKPGRNV